MPKAPQDPSKPLKNIRHERVLLEYIRNGGCAALAYRTVYPGSNVEASHPNGSRLMARPEVCARLEYLATQALKRQHKSADAVLAELAHLGFSDIGDLTWKPGERNSAGVVISENEVGTLKPLHEMPPHVRRAIRSIKYDAQGRPEITMWSEKGSLTHLARYHKLIDSASVNVNIDFGDALRKAREKRLKKK